MKRFPESFLSEAGVERIYITGIFKLRSKVKFTHVTNQFVFTVLNLFLPNLPVLRKTLIIRKTGVYLH